MVGIHHLAIGTKKLQEMVDFYSQLPGLTFVEWKYDENGNQRSGWLKTKEGTLIMIEKKENPRGSEALVFSLLDLSEGEKNSLPNSTHVTDYTLYFQDPDGNKLGYSSFPGPLRDILSV